MGLHRKRKRRPATTTSYIAMLGRMIRAGESRVAQDARCLPDAHELEAEVTNMVNVAIYRANHEGGKSYNQLADLMGVSKAAVIKRAQLGERVARQREQRQQAVPAARVARPRELPPRLTAGATRKQSRRIPRHLTCW